MPAKPKDHTGKTYGRLTGICDTGKRSKNRTYIWLWKCSCGNEVEIIPTSVVRGLSQSCGCLHKEKVSESGKIIGKLFGKLNLRTDDIGKQYNDLIFLKHTEKRYGRDTYGMFKCVLCETEVELIVANVRKGYTTSCGCRTKSNLHTRTRDILQKNNIEIVQEEYPLPQNFFSFDDRKSILKVDFLILYRDIYVGIECQGQQHYKPFDYFGGEEGFLKIQQRDELKAKCLKVLNIPLIYIKYNQKNIEEYLLEQLEMLYELF